MEARHVRWAMQHDWYIGCSYNTERGKWVVQVRDTLADSGIEYMMFTCIDALKHWAGY